MTGAPPRQPEMDPRMQRLLTLLTLHKNARHKKTLAELGFMMVNQTFNLVPYRHGVFWRWDGTTVTMEAASGLVALDEGGPYAQWLGKVIAHQLRDQDDATWLKIGDQPQAEGDARCRKISVADAPEKERADWQEWASSHALLVTMKGANGKTTCGLWLDRDEAFHDADTAFLEDLGDGFAHAVRQLGGGGKSWTKSLLRPTKSGTTIFLALLLAAMFIPVRMTATAPAEVVARSPSVVTVPFDGIIEKAAVEPNQSVKKGDTLLIMDSTVLKNQLELAQRELDTARVALDKTEREALGDPKKRNEINVLRAQIAARESETNFAQDMLSRAAIKAEEDGVVVFPDAKALTGRPARTGEQVMLLARPRDTELLIRVPVDAMIDVNTDIPTNFFLNVSPLSSRAAQIETISYQPGPDSDGMLSYRIRAQFTDKENMPRVGWTGTAKVYGETSFMLFNVLRRPLIALRRKLGV